MHLRLTKARHIFPIIAVDAIIIAGAFFMALELRFDFELPWNNITHFALAIPVITAAFLAFNAALGIYSGKWKYASFDEIWALFRATVLTSVIAVVFVLVVPRVRQDVPVGVTLSGAVIALLALCALRLFSRLFGESRMRKAQPGGKNVLIVGAGEAGEAIAHAMMRNPNSGYNPVAFVDDNPFKKHLILVGLPVRGDRNDIPELVEKLGVEEIVIAMPSVGGQDLREIIGIIKATGATLKILPAISRFLTTEIDLSLVRELKPEDLLGRHQVEIDLDLVAGYISGKVVLVTGAGGSIGSELCRQLTRFHPAELLLLDNDETSLFNLLIGLSPNGLRFEPIVADIREKQRIRSVFEKYRPAIVFHSAALKHVPMMELHPCEAVKNNVLGTLNVAEAAADFGTERFMMISTDKAVQPTNVMGATKRLSEIVVKKRNETSSTAFGIVRFGNVLGSRGSVVPTFEAQIKNGGPVLVTDPDVTRYFMTISEAAQLVVQAGAFMQGGEVFILDMGEPIRIMELAEKMIGMLGNGRKIDITITGLRPGEKLHEELVYRGEQLQPTRHPKISIVNDDNGVVEEFYGGINALINLARREREDEVMDILQDLISLGNHGVQVEKRAMPDDAQESIA